MPEAEPTIPEAEPTITETEPLSTNTLSEDLPVSVSNPDPNFFPPDGHHTVISNYFEDNETQEKGISEQDGTNLMSYISDSSVHTSG